MSALSAKNRASFIDQLQNQHFDVFIVGGGIVGAGAAREAALRGLKVGLIEAEDFASGTSSKSSKLIHGGIRYLENFEFKLVFEALSERAKLFEIAPHLVHPLRFMIPLYDGGRVGMSKMSLGMWAYDALALFQAPEMHERLSVSESLQRMPLLQEKSLLGSFVYSDAYTDDDRLVFETLRNAANHGAVQVNYAKATDVQLNDDGRIKRVKVKDQMSAREFWVSADHFISSVGPWTDLFGKAALKDWKKMLRPTKGVHLTFERQRLPLGSAVVMAAEKRIVFGIPRHEMVIVGTTDTDFSSDPGSALPDKNDIKYLLGVINQYFPKAGIQESDICASYAGVRPLVDDGAENEGKTSREHTIKTIHQNLTVVAGGKYTTYRLMSEQILDEVLRTFPIEKRARALRQSSQSPLNPLVTSDSYAHRESELSRVVEVSLLNPSEATLLLDRHGGEAFEIIKSAGRTKTYWQLEAHHAVHHTMCFHLRDFYARRVPLFLSKRDHGLSFLEDISQIFAKELSWSADQLKNEVSLLHQYMDRELSWRA